MKIRSLVVLLLTVGIVWGCETTDPLVQDARLYLQIMDFDSSLEAANEALEADSSNAAAHYYRGYALAAIAEDINPPEDRRPYYEDFRRSMQNARHFGETAESRPDELDDIDDLIVTVWANEHNWGVEMITDDSTRQANQNPDLMAVQHFQNAIIIEPDSVITEIVLSSIQYQMGDLAAATATYENVMSKLDEPEYDDYEYLITLYLVQDRHHDAGELTREAMDAYPDEIIFAQFLADIYLETGETERALDMLHGLIEANPEEANFHFVLGTYLYERAEQRQQQATERYQQAYQATAGSDEAERLRAEADVIDEEAEELMEESASHVRNAADLAPDDDSSFNVLGVIYQNRAAALFDKRNNTRDNALASEIDAEAREHLHTALGYYERATELNPDESNYWLSLFQIYTTLGMDEQAEEAMQKADI